MSNTMLTFLESVKENNPELSELVDNIVNIYTTTSVSTENIDFTFMRYPPGHFANPLPSAEEFNSVAPRVFSPDTEHNLPAIDLNIEGQLALHDELAAYYPDCLYLQDSPPPLRCSFPNGWFAEQEAFCLQAIMRKFRPNTIVEIGSGFSSCVMLDTNQYFLDHKTKLYFVEPYPENRLLHLLSEQDHTCCSVLKGKVQDIAVESFSILEENDILFVDSSHVGKIGSDVLHILNYILPALKPGVFIHFHDIPFPFEFPYEHYVEVPEAWNEMYFLRTFLQYNHTFKIRYFSSYLKKHHEETLSAKTPRGVGGGSLWLQKIA